MHILLPYCTENYQKLWKTFTWPLLRTQYAEQILFEEKISIFNFVVGERRRKKNSNFSQLSKIQSWRENRTYAMLKSVFSTIHTRNLKNLAIAEFCAIFHGNCTHLESWAWNLFKDPSGYGPCENGVRPSSRSANTAVLLPNISKPH